MEVMSELFTTIQKLDASFQFYLNQEWRNPFFDFILPLFSSTLLLCVIVALGLAYIAWRRGWRALAPALKVIILVAIAVGATDSVCRVIKDDIGRVRPYQAIAGCYYQADGNWLRNSADFIATETRGSSFPSGHAANTTAICLSLLFLFGNKIAAWKKGLLTLMPFIVGWSRLYLGKHYVFDVLGGILVGCVVVSVLWILWKCLERRLPPMFQVR